MNTLIINPAPPPLTGETGNPALPEGSTPTQPVLLPSPEVSPDDALAGLLILEALSRGVGLTTAINDVNSLREQKHEEWEKQKAALMEAMKAQEDSGFWGSLGDICGTIGKIAAVVASVAVALGTGGAGAPLVLAVAGACLSSAALLQSELHVLQELGVSDEVAGYIEIGMAVGSVACSFGASALKSADAVDKFGKIMTTTGRIAGAGSAVATGVQGAAIIEKADADGTVADRYADVAKAKLAESHLEQLLLMVLDQLDDSEKEYRRTVSGMKDAIVTRDATLLLASGMA